MITGLQLEKVADQDKKLMKFLVETRERFERVSLLDPALKVVRTSTGDMIVFCYNSKIVMTMVGMACVLMAFAIAVPAFFFGFSPTWLLLPAGFWLFTNVLVLPQTIAAVLQYALKKAGCNVKSKYISPIQIAETFARL